MPNLTLEIPDDLHEKLNALPEEWRNISAVAWMRSGASLTPEDIDYADAAEFEDACAKIAAGLADARVGRTLSLEEAKADFAQVFAARRKPKE